MGCGGCRTEKGLYASRCYRGPAYIYGILVLDQRVERKVQHGETDAPQRRLEEPLHPGREAGRLVFVVLVDLAALILLPWPLRLPGIGPPPLVGLLEQLSVLGDLEQCLLRGAGAVRLLQGKDGLAFFFGFTLRHRISLSSYPQDARGNLSLLELKMD